LTIRLLIVSTLDSQEPFGAFTRPFYLGMYLSRQFEVCQLGIDCSAVDYSQSISIGSRGLKSYIKALQNAIAEFQPDVVYAQETLPATAALILFTRQPQQCRLIFDFHTLSAFEYWTRLSTAKNKSTELKQFIKTYLAQGTLIFSGRPIIAASQSIVDMIPRWYIKQPQKIASVGNGVSEDLLNLDSLELANPYTQLQPAKIVTVIAPKTFSFPTNDMSVEMTIEIARYLETPNRNIHFVVIGRDAEDIPLPSNITFTGFLPQRSDFLAHLKYTDIGLLPFPEKAVAGGARNKALDYLACQKLVISTPEGLRGLEAFKDREHLLITSYSIEDIAQTISDVCSNLDRYQPLIDNSYQLIANEYSWSAMAEKVANIIKANT
jgi:glycosyltransferase involved in cell wall biosynthesis